MKVFAVGVTFFLAVSELGQLIHGAPVTCPPSFETELPTLIFLYQDQTNSHTFSGYEETLPNKSSVSWVEFRLPTGSPTQMCAALYKTQKPSGDPVKLIGPGTVVLLGGELMTVGCFKVYNQTCDSLIPTTTTTAVPNYNEAN